MQEKKTCVMLNTSEYIFGKLHCHREKSAKTYFLIGDHGCMFHFFYGWLPWEPKVILHSCLSAENLQWLLNGTAAIIWTKNMTRETLYSGVQVASKWLHKINGYCSERSDVVGWPWLAARCSPSCSLNTPSSMGQERK